MFYFLELDNVLHSTDCACPRGTLHRSPPLNATSTWKLFSFHLRYHGLKSNFTPNESKTSNWDFKIRLGVLVSY